MWSNVRPQEDFGPDYFTKLWAWYKAGGLDNVAAYLRQRDLSGFNAKAPPPKTDAWHEIVSAGRAPEDAEMADVLEHLGRPAIITLDMLMDGAARLGLHDFGLHLRDRRARRQIPHRIESGGYVRVGNRHADDGLWRIDGRRQALYGRGDLTESARIGEAAELARR